MPFDENSYLAYFAGRQDCVIFDPGMEPGKIIAEVEQRQLTPAAILCTHGHSDHIAGNEAMKERWPDCPLLIGKGDAEKLTDPVGNLSAGFGIELISPPADRTVAEGEVLELAGFQLEVLETPGHQSGHVVFVARGLSPLQVFGGDVLFAGSVGRTDFPGCSFKVLKRSIHDKLFPLADETIVLPGHGPSTTIGREKASNPFVGLGGQWIVELPFSVVELIGMDGSFPGYLRTAIGETRLGQIRNLGICVERIHRPVQFLRCVGVSR